MTIEIQHRDALGFVRDSHDLNPGSSHGVDGKIFGPRYEVEALSEHIVKVRGLFNGEVVFEETASGDEINKLRYLKRERQILPSPNITVSWSPDQTPR